MAAAMKRMAAGALAGTAGMVAMDLVWYARYRAGGGDDGFFDWEFATSTESFDDAAAPGQVAAKVAGAVGLDLPDSTAGVATNVVHWLTGLGYGVVHGVLNHRRPAVRGGLLTGAAAFANSYATLGAIGVYQPIWEYDRDALTKDLSAHLVFGAVTGLAYRLLTGRERG